jgi:hypothetical protein
MPLCPNLIGEVWKGSIDDVRIYNRALSMKHSAKKMLASRTLW